MRTRWLMLGGLVLAGTWCASRAPAQIEIAWTLAHDRTVLMEPVRAVVGIANHSGRTLDLTPNGNAELSFLVEDRPTSTVPGTGRPLLRQPVIVPAGETRDVEVNLLDGYRLVKGQAYQLAPVVDFAGMRFWGARRPLEIQPGIELFKRRYGLPAAGDAREVSLRLIHRERSDRLFIRIDDYVAGFCLGVYELGRVIRYFEPRLELDRNGVFQALHQTSPDRFALSSFGYDGEPLGTELYVAPVGSIRLVRDGAGDVAVTGGTPYQEDPDHPGSLIAPALPPSHPYAMTLGDDAGKDKAPAGKRTPAQRKPTSVRRTGERGDEGSEPVSW